MTPHAATPKQCLRRLASGLLTHTVLVTAAIIMLLPLAWMVSTSLKQSGIGLSRGIEWLPWRDAWARGGQTIDVIVLGARVLPDGAQEAAEVGIKSLASRRRQTRVYVPDGAYDAEILAWRVRPMTGEDETAEAQWAPFDSVRRRVAPEWGNYREALEKMRFWVCLANTLAITFLGTAGTILSCSLVAYGFARFRFPGNNFLFLVLLSSMMLPSVVTMIPVYLLFRELHWIDTLLPLFAPAWFSVNAFAVFLFRQYYMTLPFDLDDAAQIDGCSALGTYWRVLLPLSKPVMATVGIFCFTHYWLDFMGPLIYLNTSDKFTLALGLYTFKGAYTTQWHYLMAATLAVSLPCIVLFFAGQRFFVRGVVMSGLKG
ncbi:MAG TPA: carbohydrate ABC transporter permease [Candidatus Hydrogenedentes bacterium]|nr:carbohydrate ABC transporter permease [Candidatus Hydrogenedentota bacterium]HQH51313.1 carbohydrate ABC transporter permease [Candidatus Hydrogenedentota bacterium]HQM49047.1 carbohydrate ABC transporter permease [Candidatus Hydrogenedentota bacterium]